MSLLAALLLLLPAPSPGKSSAPTFCVEWIRQSSEGYERFTLFADRNLVWKTSARGEDQVRRKLLSAEEAEFYCGYFARPEFWDLPGDLRAGLTGEFIAQSSVTVARPDGSRRQIRFDEMSALPAEAAALKAALQGFREIFIAPIAPASRFTPQALPPGTVLKRFDGALFRVRRLEAEKGFVELEGLSEPFSLYKKIDELRFQFLPPE